MRRSYRSVIGPAASPTIRFGAERTANATPTSNADPVISNTSQPIITCEVPCPNWFANVEMNNVLISGYRNAAVIPANLDWGACVSSPPTGVLIGVCP